MIVMPLLQIHFGLPPNNMIYMIYWAMDRIMDIMDNLETHCEHFQTFNPSKCSWCELIMKPCTMHLQKQKPRQAISCFFHGKPHFSSFT